MNNEARIKTWEHKREVHKRLNAAAQELMDRGVVHDQSKLEEPEVEIFDKYTAKLAESTYGSDEYKQFLEEMKPALEHHYAKNRHHPEHHKDGVRDMTLFDIIEMLADWKAATLRHNDGNINKSIDMNQQRFGYSDELKQILLNTIKTGIFD